MYHKTRQPNIILEIPHFWYNSLISALVENTKIEELPAIVDGANTLISKLKKFSRPYIDNETEVPCVDIRIFPTEASEMITQLLFLCGNFVSDSEVDFYSQLNVIKVPNDENQRIVKVEDN